MIPIGSVWVREESRNRRRYASPPRRILSGNDMRITNMFMVGAWTSTAQILVIVLARATVYFLFRLFSQPAHVYVLNEVVSVVPMH